MCVGLPKTAESRTCGIFGCTFLWSFLLCKQKKGHAVYIKTKKRKELKNILYWIEEEGTLPITEKKNQIILPYLFPNAVIHQQLICSL